ncbi:DUF5675 family protein [bacterium]|nr:DUF5675 family protein [bacterium]
MYHWRIKRLAESHSSGTMGILGLNGSVFSHTLELPNMNNRPHKSCIPPGNYVLIRVPSDNYGETFEVQGDKILGVRTLIRVHPANKIQELRGCIALGYSLNDFLAPQRKLVNSRPAWQKFMDIMDGHDIAKLTITEDWL